MSTNLLVAGKELWEALELELPSDIQPAITFNSHITGLAVARSLGKKGIPIISLDRDGRAYGLSSKYVKIAAFCPNPITNEREFVDLLIEIGKRLPQKGVLFPSNDEWVFAVSRHRQELEQYYDFPFSYLDVIDQILNKKLLYKKAEELNIPIPKTWYPDEWATVEELAEHIPYPCIVKPVEQRSFYDAFEVKVYAIKNKQELHDIFDTIKGHEVVVQEIIGEKLSDFYSLCSYVSKDGDMKGTFIGKKLEQYPASFGTGCLVYSEYIESIASNGANILKSLGYYGISETEFIFDERDQTYKLLDLNTRTWKWIGLPIHAGVDLPYMAYQEAIGNQVEKAEQQRDGIKWVYSKDYFKLKKEHGGVSPSYHLKDNELLSVISGHLPTENLIDAVLDKDDPKPSVQLLKNSYSQGYVCPC